MQITCNPYTNNVVAGKLIDNKSYWKQPQCNKKVLANLIISQFNLYILHDFGNYAIFKIKLLNLILFLLELHLSYS